MNTAVVIWRAVLERFSVINKSVRWVPKVRLLTPSSLVFLIESPPVEPYIYYVLLALAFLAQNTGNPCTGFGSCEHILRGGFSAVMS